MTLELEKKNKKERKEEEKAERKGKREERKKSTTGKKRKMTGEVHDIEEDWVCKKCQIRYSSELITKKRRRWVECDKCHGTFHYKCIPKLHLDTYGLDEDDEDEEDVNFICHLCVDDNLATMTLLS